jgi:hypothetical protein
VSANRLDRMAAAFVRERPDCIRLLVRLARAKKAEGERRLSMKALFEEARPRVRKTRTPGRKRRVWSLNNSLTSRVARILAATYSDLRGCFEFRGLSS